MDSRIREIEQWIAEARTELDDSGKEAYLNKLYLLDAEIRAVIKDNGEIPGGKSPGHPVKNVRRSIPSLALAGIIGIFIFSATTVYLGLQFSQPKPTVTEKPFTPSIANRIAREGSQVIANAFIPASIPGEEILPDGWAPEEITEGIFEEMTIESPSDAVVEAVLSNETCDEPVSDKPVNPSPPVLMLANAHLNGTTANQATSLVASNKPGSVGIVEPAVYRANGIEPAGEKATSTGNGEVERRIAFSYFPEAEKEEEETVNTAKEELSSRLDQQPEVVIVDNSDDEDVDNSEPALDTSKLLETLEKKINQHNNS